MYNSPILRYILGVDNLQGLWLQTIAGKFRLRVCEEKAVLKGHVKQLPVALPVPQRVTNTKQYKLSEGPREIRETLQELEKVGIIKPTHSPYNSVKKPDGFWHVTVDYRELNKVTPTLHVAVLSIAHLLDRLSNELGMDHVVDLANAFFSISLSQESQEQFAFM